MKQEIKRAILVEVVVAVLILVFFEPILKLIWRGIVGIGTYVGESYVNNVYKNAALGHRNYIDVLILFFITVLVYSAQIGFLLSSSDKISRLVRDKLSRKGLSIVLTVLTVIGLISLLFSEVAVFADLQMNTSFQQRLTVLAPHISDQEYKELEASWASMQDREDYETVNAQMESLAEQRNIELPDLLLK